MQVSQLIKTSNIYFIPVLCMYDVIVKRYYKAKNSISFGSFCSRFCPVESNIFSEADIYSSNTKIPLEDTNW